MNVPRLRREGAFWSPLRVQPGGPPRSGPGWVRGRWAALDSDLHGVASGVRKLDLEASKKTRWHWSIPIDIRSEPDPATF